MSAIELQGVSKIWGETAAVNDVSFSIDQGTFAVLLGPSGCGKSTSLRMISGLEEISKGSLFIGGEDATIASPADRNLSMVFQNYALFPHLNVEENILFGLKVRNTPKQLQKERLKKVAEQVGLEQLLDRKPAQLSGGQRQRVALARAIIAENPICLMDEPLSNLDAKLRHIMRVEIRALQQRLGMTVIYVTHDQAEAMSMADKVILMCDGKVEQEGTPEELYNKPATTFAAAFIGTPPMNLIDPVACGIDKKISQNQQDNFLIGIRPEDIVLSNKDGLKAELISADYLGADTVVTAKIQDQEILVRTPGKVTITKPTSTRLQWPVKSVHVFDKSTGKRNDNIEVSPI